MEITGIAQWALLLPVGAVLQHLRLETLTISQAADLLGVSRQTIYSYIDRGDLEVVIIEGPRRKIRRITVESFRRLREKILRSREQAS
jgi:excisionase family DNA binding protein